MGVPPSLSGLWVGPNSLPVERAQFKDMQTEHRLIDVSLKKIEIDHTMKNRLVMFFFTFSACILNST